MYSPENRFAAYYAATFASIGAISPFFALWLHSRGVDARMIGIIAAAPSLAMILTTVRLARWADSLDDRRLAIIAGNWVLLFLQLSLFWPLSESAILLIWTMSGLVMFALVPITDAAALAMTERRRSDFARVRVYGSIGFVIAVSGAGYLFDVFGMRLFVPILLAGNALRLSLSYALPSLRSPASDTASDTVLLAPSAAASNTLYQAGVLLTLAGAALINASHAVVNTFGILLWTQQGFSESLASGLISVGVLAEVLLMWRFRSLTRQLSARACLLAAGAAGMLRWCLLAYSSTPLLMACAQLLHGMTFGVMFLATATFISRRVDERVAARAQGFSATVMTATMAFTVFFAGYRFDELGSDLYWFMAALCTVGITLVASSYRTSLRN